MPVSGKIPKKRSAKFKSYSARDLAERDDLLIRRLDLPAHGAHSVHSAHGAPGLRRQAPGPYPFHLSCRQEEGGGAPLCPCAMRVCSLSESIIHVDRNHIPLDPECGQRRRKNISSTRRMRAKPTGRRAGETAPSPLCFQKIVRRILQFGRIAQVNREIIARDANNPERCSAKGNQFAFRFNRTSGHLFPRR